MSFISILKKIGSVTIGAEHIVAPVIEAAVPAISGPVAALDGIFQRLQATIATVEANNPTDGQGGIKAQAVTADFQSGLDLTQQILALKGEKLTYDASALQSAIDAQTAAFNAFAKLKASFKVDKL
jgi:hypothetical protein